MQTLCRQVLNWHFNPCFFRLLPMINKSHKFIILVMVIFLLGSSYFLWFQVIPTQKSHDIEGLLWPKVQAITDFQLVNTQ